VCVWTQGVPPCMCGNVRTVASGRGCKVDTRVHCHQRGLRVCSGPDAFSCIHTLPCCICHTARPSPTTPQREHRQSSAVTPHQSGCHRATQRCTHGLTEPTTSRRGRRACALGEGPRLRQQLVKDTLPQRSLIRCFQVYTALQPARQYWCSHAAQHSCGTRVGSVVRSRC
jgi:hypothetical protein